LRSNLSGVPIQTDLHGREPVLDALGDWLRSPLASAALVGAPGVGKTAVLRRFGATCEVAHADRVDEIWWCDMGGVTNVSGILDRIAAVTGVGGEDVGDVLRVARGIITALTRRGRVLLLLDGVDNVILHDRGRLPAEVFDGSRVRWVLSSRVTTGIADRRIFLGPLAPDAAVAVLEDSAKRAGAVRVDAAPGEMVALAEQLDRVPLALELGGHWLNTLTPPQLSAALARHSSFLSEDEHAGGLQSALAETWARAGDEDRDAIVPLCAPGTDFTVEMAAALWGTDIARAARQLRRLQWLSLVWPSSEGGRRRFSVYMAVRGFVLQVAPAGALDVARERAARWLADGFERWDLGLRRAEAVTLAAVFDWAIVSHVPLAARLALASLSMAEDGDAFAQRLRQLSLALERVIDAPAWDKDVATRLYLAIGRGHLLARDAAGALEALDRAFTLAGDPDVDPALRGRVACALAQTHLLAGHLGPCEDAARRALELADDDDVPSRVEASGVLAFLRAEQLDLAGANAAYADLRRDAEWRGGAAELSLADSVAFRLVADTGAVEQLTDNPRPSASPRAVAEFWHRRGETMLALGLLDEAERSYRAVMSESELHHDVRLARVTAGGLAAVSAVRGHEAFDPTPLADLTRYYETGDWRYLETRARLHWGVALALAGQPRAGWRQLSRALDDAGAMGMRAHALAFRAVGSVVAHLAGAAGPEVPAGDVPGPAWLNTSFAMARALKRGDALPPEGSGERWSQRAIRLLAAGAHGDEAVEPSADSDGMTLEIGHDWRWFRVGSGSPISLTRRNAGRRILQHLIKLAEASPDATVTRNELVAIGWPGERMLPESGVARVHTTLWRLRQLGLGEVLVSHDDGYRLRDRVRVVFSEAAPG